MDRLGELVLVQVSGYFLIAPLEGQVLVLVAVQTVLDRVGLEDDRYAAVIHPSAVISPSATIGPGAVILAQCVVGPSASIEAI